MKLVSWNTAKRVKRTEDQFTFLRKFGADIVALQEIIPSSETKWRELLNRDYEHIISSFELAPDVAVLKKKRMFGQIIASKFPLTPIPPDQMRVPWQERVLAVQLHAPKRDVRLLTTHIPPGASNGWIKIATLKGIIEDLLSNLGDDHILCGDFNTPQSESAELGLVTFGQRITGDGRAITRKNFRGGEGKEWDAVERTLFEDLKKYGIRDAFREKHPTSFDSYSRSFVRRGKTFRNRFDHVFLSEALTVETCEFQNNQGELSDHSPIVTVINLNEEVSSKRKPAR